MKTRRGLIKINSGTPYSQININLLNVF